MEVDAICCYFCCCCCCCCLRRGEGKGWRRSRTVTASARGLAARPPTLRDARAAGARAGDPSKSFRLRHPGILAAGRRAEVCAHKGTRAEIRPELDLRPPSSTEYVPLTHSSRRLRPVSLMAPLSSVSGHASSAVCERAATSGSYGRMSTT